MHDGQQYRCDLCRKPIVDEPHRHEWHWLKHYEMMLCPICFQGNWDGIGPVFERAFEKHLKDKNIPLPARNSKGRYPRES